MNKIFVLVSLLFSVVTFGQDNFISGYYIDQNNKKIEGFIEDVNPYNNPEKINFKYSLEDNSNEISIINIKEFKVNSNYKYVRYIVDYDYGQVVNRSEINIYGKEPDLKKKTVLAKVLIEGNVSLYKVIIDDAIFFYFKNSNDESPTLLIHRKYNTNNTISENNDFRKQVYDVLKSDKLVIGDFLNLKFEERELVRIFNKANTEDNSLVEQNVNLEKYKNKIFYKIFVGVSAATSFYKIAIYDMKPTDVTFTSPTVGIEFSNVFGTNSKRSELFGRLFYQNSKSKSNYHSSENIVYDLDYTINSKLSTINLTGGYRYAIFQKGKNKITIDGSIGVTNVVSGDVTIDYLVTYTGSSPNLSITERTVFDKFSTNIFFNGGVGYIFDNKYAINLEYSPQKNYLSKYLALSGGFSNFNLLFTYTLN